MAGQRFEGQNLEDALDSAATALGVPRYQIEHRVVVEKRGFLGGLKRVVIEAEANPDKQPPPPPPTPAPLAPRARQQSRPEGGRSGGRSERSRGGRGREGEGRGPRRREEPPDSYLDKPERLPVERQPAEPAPEQGEQSAAAARIAEWLHGLFERAGLEIEVRTEESEDQIDVGLYGPDAWRASESDGELLDATQTLLGKSLVGRETEKKIELDAGGFKKQRSSELADRARELADRVRSDGREQLLPAMNPAERRIVHLALQDDADVVTVSRGEGFFKRVAILLKEDASADDSRP